MLQQSLSGAVEDEMHIVFECVALAPLRQQHASLVTVSHRHHVVLSPSNIIWEIFPFVSLIDCLDCTAGVGDRQVLRGLQHASHGVHCQHRL